MIHSYRSPFDAWLTAYCSVSILQFRTDTESEIRLGMWNDYDQYRMLDYGDYIEAGVLMAHEDHKLGCDLARIYDEEWLRLRFKDMDNAAVM